MAPKMPPKRPDDLTNNILDNPPSATSSPPDQLTDPPIDPLIGDHPSISANSASIDFIWEQVESAFEIDANQRHFVMECSQQIAYSEDCGYCLMRFLKDIITHGTMLIPATYYLIHTMKNLRTVTSTKSLRNVSWKSSKQSTIADSTTEAEYIATSDTAKEAIWIKKFITELGVVPSILDPINLFYDNSGAIVQSKEPRSHQKTKHILRRFHLIREINDRGDIKICKVAGEDSVANPLTKPPA
ncbi:uncharacterized protein LOC129308954 [Prosopis cineraria]|uniref:uncharacterized protein LOC129308954 n=1 Tax=Prosopis cineraria TaxID=364024 RepID=UPI002410488E|nr:uncharacterized protein LOC129308954 [Prosopis cineraria]